LLGALVSTRFAAVKLAIALDTLAGLDHAIATGAGAFYWLGHENYSLTIFVLAVHQVKRQISNRLPLD
jgi:hypothetical protein